MNTPNSTTEGTSRDRGLVSVQPPPLKAVPVRHYGQWAAAAVVIYLGVALLVSLAKNPNLEWSTVAVWLFKEVTLKGLLVTLELTVVSMVLGVAGGVVLAVMRLSDNRILTSVAAIYIWFFRGVPLLVQIIFWGYLASMYPQLTFGIPLSGVVFFTGDTNTLISAFVGAVIALSTNEAAFSAELVRAGIISIDSGQIQAAHSLGMRFTLTMRRVVLPQAMRVIIPPMGNETITMLKMTALVSIIGAGDLFTVLQRAYSQNFKVVPLLLVASLWYLLLVTLLSIGQHYLEKHFSQGVVSATHKGHSGRRSGLFAKLPSFGRDER